MKKHKVLKPKKYQPEGIRIQRISYIGNRSTNKHTNNVRIYVQPFFDSTDDLTVVDFKTRTMHKHINITDIKCGKYKYQKVSSSIFGKHTGLDCIMVPIEHRRSGMLPTTKCDKYMLFSSNNTGKKPILLLIVNNALYESVLKI